MLTRMNGRVTFDISEDDYYGLLMVLGGAIALANTPAFTRVTLSVANAINEGNRDWVPFELPALVGSARI